MLREMETAFNLLRAWDLTTLYEKSYFILVHFALLLLGIYSIKNRIFGGRQKRRPTSLPSSSAQLLPNDSAQGSKSQESNFKLERDLIWAKELASWILKNSYANDAISNWKSKINGRLLHNMSKEKVQIDEIKTDDIKFHINKIKTYKPEITGQMNIVVYLQVEKLDVMITFTNDSGRCQSSNLILRSLCPLLHIQLIGFNGKIKPCLKLSFLNTEEIDMELNAEGTDAELVKDSFRRSLQDSVSLEARRGILKKEIKTETKIKEVSSQVEESQLGEVTDCERHILVTDLDSAIAKVSSSSPQIANSTMSKKSENTPLKLKILLPIRRSPLTPEIKVQPATPIASGIDECGIISASSMATGHLAAVKHVELDHISGDIDNPQIGKEKKVMIGKDDPAGLSEICESNVQVEVSEFNEAIEEEPCLEIVDDTAVVSEDCKEDEMELGRRGDGESCDEKHQVDEEVTGNVIKEEQETIEEDEEKIDRELENEIPDTNSESSKDSIPLKTLREKIRPKSLSEVALDKRGVMDQSLDSKMESFEKKSKTDIKRVNTFHLGSKSMVSIATTPKRADSMPLRVSSSQMSLASPVGYNPKKPSALIIESDEQGKKHYYHVPPAVAKKGTYEQRGLKLHVYNGHVFVAQHFSKPLPLCAVCSLPLARRLGKQGYQCRDCKAISHKRCHTLIGVCEETRLPSMNIEYPWSTDV